MSLLFCLAFGAVSGQATGGVRTQSSAPDRMAPARRLPPGWVPIGREIPAPQRQMEYHAIHVDGIVDETGRYMYLSEGDRWDFLVPGHKQFGNSLWGSQSAPPNKWWETLQLSWGGDARNYGVALVWARGDSVAGEVYGPPGGLRPIWTKAGQFVARIGGRPARMTQGTCYSQWLRVGIPVLVNGWSELGDASTLPRTERFKYGPGTALLLAGQSVQRLRLPKEVAIHDITGVGVHGGILPRQRVFYTGYFRKYEQINYGRSPATVRLLPPMGGGSVGLLDDDTILTALGSRQPATQEQSIASIST